MAETKSFYSAFDFVSEPVIIVKKQLIAYMNPAASRLLGREICGKPAALLFPSYIMNTQADSFAATAVLNDISFAVRVSTAEGFRVYVLDPTELSTDQNRYFIINLKSRMGSLQVGMSYLHAVAETMQNDKLDIAYATINRNLYRMHRSFRNAETVCGLAEKKLPFRPETLDISEFMRRLITDVRGVCGEKQLKISLNAEEHLRLNADRQLLECMILNLLSNSIAHCGKNGRISVSMIRGDTHLTIGIDDDGEGMSADEMSVIFRKYQTPVDLSRADDGDGFGLAIVRGIAEWHGGTIIIESRGKGRGSSVRVMLSYSVKASESFRSPNEDFSESTRQNILTQMSSCLSDACYSEIPKELSE